MLNHDHGSACNSEFASYGIDGLNDTVGLKGFEFARAEGLLDVDDEERGLLIQKLDPIYCGRT